MRTRWLLIPALTVLILACGPAPQAGPAPTADTGQQLTIKRGGVLKYATPGQAANMNPFLHTGSARTSAFDQVYEPLFATRHYPHDNFNTDDMIRWDYRADDDTIPWLAESWEQPNPTTYVFKLRKGVKWSDGTEFTAADVAFTWDHLKKNKYPRDTTRALSIESFEIVDKHTIRANLTQPDPLFLKNWREESYILPKHVADRGDSFEKVAIGTGPFVIKEHSNTAGVKHVRNDAYWDQPRPYPDGIQVFYGLARDTMMSAFITSKLDLVKPEDYGGQLHLEQGAPNAPNDTYLASHGRGFVMNMTRPPFNDVRVRRAVNMTIDRQALITRVNQGKMGLPNPPGTGSFAPRYALPQDELMKYPGFNPANREKEVAEAKRLLAEAGHPGGFRTKLSFDPSATSGKQITEIGANQLLDIGIQVELEPLDRGLWNKKLVDGDYAMAQVNFSDGVEEPPFKTYHEHFHTKGSFGGKIGLGDPELDRLIERLGNFKTDDERIEIQRAVQRRILDQAYGVPLIDVLIWSWWQPWVHGYFNERANQVKPRFQPSTIWIDTDLLPADRRSEKP